MKVEKCVSLGPHGHGQIPTVGLGTFTVFGQRGDPASVGDAVKAAIDAGYRHIDCAWNYGNEAEVGKAIKEKTDAGVVKRDDLFVTTKLWSTHHSPSLVKRALEDSLKKLQLQYVDMFLVHWPHSLKPGDFHEVFPKDKDGKVPFGSENLLETYKAVEECLRAGLTKNIGISNFNSKQVQRILDSCSVRPSNMQIEISPYFSNKRLADFCKEKGMVVTAYAPLGASTRPWREEGEPNPFEDPVLKDIASKTGKSVAQVILRSHLQNGICVVPKSITPARLKENLDVYDFELSDEDMRRIASLNRDLRVYKEPIAIGHPEYPFDEPF